jgi:hypothetical protein
MAVLAFNRFAQQHDDLSVSLALLFSGGAAGVHICQSVPNFDVTYLIF